MVACGSDQHSTAGAPDLDEVGGAAGSPAAPEISEGGSAGVDNDSSADGGTTDGGTASIPEPECLVAGRITTRVPAGTFLIDALNDEDPGQQFAQLGPWLMTFRTSGPGKLEAAVVSSHSDLWAKNGFESASFELEADEHGVYRLPNDSHAALATYAYDSSRVPGLCLHRGEVELFGRDDDDVPSSELRFYDTNGDDVADRLTLRGTLVTLGQVGGDFGTDCGNEDAPLHTDGELIDWPIAVRPDGDAMHPQLRLDGGLLKEGHAEVLFGSSYVAAVPLTSSGFIHGFAAPFALQPGAALTWRVQGLDVLERSFAVHESPVGDVVEPWLLVTDQGFETFADGESWGDGFATARASFTGDSLSPALPPIAGERSLHIRDRQSGGSRFRFARRAGQTELSFLVFGPAHAEAALVGHQATNAFEVSPADCAAHATFCAAAPTGYFRKYTLQLEPGTEDVLLAIHDRSAAFGLTAGDGIWVDELRLSAAP